MFSGDDDDAGDSGGSKGGGGAAPTGSNFFLQKAAFFRVKGLYRSLCAFAINGDGADKLSSAPPLFEIFGSVTG